MKYTEQQLYDLEDKIYVLLGELGDNNPEIGNDRNEQQSVRNIFKLRSLKRLTDSLGRPIIFRILW
jgi:hypothetical protein